MKAIKDLRLNDVVYKPNFDSIQTYRVSGLRIIDDRIEVELKDKYYTKRYRCKPGLGIIETDYSDIIFTDLESAIVKQIRIRKKYIQGAENILKDASKKYSESLKICIDKDTLLKNVVLL